MSSYCSSPSSLIEQSLKMKTRCVIIVMLTFFVDEDNVTIFLFRVEERSLFHHRREHSESADLRRGKSGPDPNDFKNEIGLLCLKMHL